MSKSLGNGVDPLEMVDAHGADATPLRTAEDVVDAGRALQRRHDRGGRKLANKLWNVAVDPLERGRRAAGVTPTSVEERWILSRLETARGHIERSLEALTTSP